MATHGHIDTGFKFKRNVIAHSQRVTYIPSPQYIPPHTTVPRGAGGGGCKGRGNIPGSDKQHTKIAKACNNLHKEKGIPP